MIVFGVAPGVRQLGYCMLEYGNGRCNSLDSDILSGKRFLAGTPNLAMIAKKFGAHRLLITTVWERHSPVILAIGPPADEREDPLHPELATRILKELGRIMGVKVLVVDGPRLAKAFATGRGRPLASIVSGAISVPLGSRHRPLTIAAATGIYAIAKNAPPPADRLLRIGL